MFDYIRENLYAFAIATLLIIIIAVLGAVYLERQFERRRSQSESKDFTTFRRWLEFCLIALLVVDSVALAALIVGPNSFRNQPRSHLSSEMTGLAHAAARDLHDIKNWQVQIIDILTKTGVVVARSNPPSPFEKTATAQTTSGTVGLNVTNFWIYCVLGLGFIGIACLTLRNLPYFEKKPEVRSVAQFLGSVALAAPIGMTAFKADSILKINDLKLSYERNGSQSGPTPTPITILFNPNQSSGALECIEDSRATFQPFGDGTSVLDRDRLEEGLKAISEWIKKKEKENKRLAGLILIGSADKRPLSLTLRNKYGDNQGLAMERVRRIEEALLENLRKNGQPISPQSVMMIYAGPTIVGDKSSGIELAEDRAVRVCGLWY